MFHNLRRNLYQKRLHLLFQEGKINGEILPFEDELFERLNHVYLNGIPVTFHLKYIRPIPHIQPDNVMIEVFGLPWEWMMLF